MPGRSEHAAFQRFWTSGSLGDQGMTALVPALKIQVQGAKNPQGQMSPNRISFSKKDLQTAQEIQAGLAPTKQEVQANQQAIQTNEQDVAANQQKIASNKQEITTDQREVNKRFSDLSDYDVKSTGDPCFEPGSNRLSEKDKTVLHQLAIQAVNLNGYVIQVKGFADSWANSVQNQKLSMERADAVIAYLQQTGNVPLRHIVAPGAMGTSLQHFSAFALRH
jgi:OOP family OmpA-OmpF porin